MQGRNLRIKSLELEIIEAVVSFRSFYYSDPVLAMCLILGPIIAFANVCKCFYDLWNL